MVEGVEQILSGNPDEINSVSPSPEAIALAAPALLAVGRGFETAQQRGLQWLRQQHRGEWGKSPGDKPVAEQQWFIEPCYRGIYAKGWNYEEPLTTALTAIRALQRYQRLYKASFFR